MIPSVYLALKGLHVASALVFFGGTLAVSLLLSMPVGPEAMGNAARAVRRWDRGVTTPAMFLVWAFGIFAAVQGHWFSSAWLQLKLAFVVAVSVIHGVQSGRLRTLAEKPGAAAAASSWRLWCVVACAVAIALLATIKPF
ncbi:CopD family protein [Roseateles sp.]|uniref:CopD family protein n=1 Tax=Roseateles sp. TaxID=1971397 RepID=UPI0039E9D5DB